MTIKATSFKSQIGKQQVPKLICKCSIFRSTQVISTCLFQLRFHHILNLHSPSSVFLAVSPFRGILCRVSTDDLFWNFSETPQGSAGPLCHHVTDSQSPWRRLMTSDTKEYAKPLSQALHEKSKNSKQTPVYILKSNITFRNWRHLKCVTIISMESISLWLKRAWYQGDHQA